MGSQGTKLAGFTLIEMTIVAAIIGILAAVAIPKFADMVRKSKEGATKGQLGALRSALSVYYAENEGLYPVCTLAGSDPCALSPKYIADPTPRVVTPNYHDKAAGGWLRVSNCAILPCGFTRNVSDGVLGGNWYYDAVIADTEFGTLVINCTHTDTKGSVWSTY